jgi:uncharacterized protein (DUF924 family)
MQDSDQALQQEIVDFWFGLPGSAEYGTTRDVWFRKDDEFDAAIRRRFGAAVDSAIAGEFTTWDTARAALARVLLLDQFTRNIYRGTPRAFAGDAIALQVAEKTVSCRDDARLIPVERWFLYLPFVHAESVASQARSVQLFTRLRDETGLAEPLDWAHRHAEVIRRFGRYPHRNAILGRESTPEELEFLAQPGSGF